MNGALEGRILKLDIQGAAVSRAKLLGLGSKLYPSNIQRMLN